MDDRKTVFLSFEDVNPLVRLAGFYPLSNISSGLWKRAYDCRITYICDGQGVIDVNRQAFPFARGDLFYWLPGERYRMTSSVEHPMQIMNICFDFTRKHDHIKFLMPQSAEEFKEGLITEIPVFSDLSAFNRTMKISGFFIAEPIIKEMVTEYKIQKKYSSHRTNGMLLSLIALMARHHTEEGRHGAKGQVLADSIIEYIHSHLKEDLSNRTLAARFGFHPVHVNRLFLQNTGIPLHQYVQNIRLQRAAELLSLTGLLVAEAAEAVGFNDPSYFSRLFKQKLGRCPSKIR